jgi:hypothetical protein
MSYHEPSGGYRCNLAGCSAAYKPEKGYYRWPEEDDEHAREIFYAQEAVCLCENDESHGLYIQDYVASRKVRFWACAAKDCDYEVSQRLEKTAEGWRTCGWFEHTKPVRIRR